MCIVTLYNIKQLLQNKKQRVGISNKFRVYFFYYSNEQQQFSFYAFFCFVKSLRIWSKEVEVKPKLIFKHTSIGLMGNKFSIGLCKEEKEKRRNKKQEVKLQGGWDNSHHIHVNKFISAQTFARKVSYRRRQKVLPINQKASLESCPLHARWCFKCNCVIESSIVTEEFHTKIVWQQGLEKIQSAKARRERKSS